MCCPPYRRLFRSQRALEQHKNSPGHAKTAAAKPRPRADSPQDLLKCRGNTYSHLSAADQSLIYELLVSSCHPPSRLQRERYILGAAEAIEAGDAQSLPTPSPSQSFPKRKAVVMDTEMAGVEGGRSEVVQLCAVDFLTGEVLVNSIVKPPEPIVDWRSNITGVTPGVMSVARARKEALYGWEAARAELWRHVDEDTVLIGQSLCCDLPVLRVIHGRIVDSAILTAEAVFGKDKKIGRMWGLKALQYISIYN